MANLLLSGPFVRVTLANFFCFLNVASFFLLPLFVKTLGGSEATVGFVMGTFGLASLLVLPLMGVAIDRFGRRRFLVLGTLGMSVAAYGFLFIDRIGPALFALRVVHGVSFAAAFTATTTLAAELAPRERRAQALGLFGVSTLLTHALAPGIGEEIIRRAGFHTLFATAATCSMLPLLLLRGVPARRIERRADAHLPWAVSRPQWVVIITMALAAMGFGAVTTFVPTFVRATGVGRVAVFFGTYSLTAILTRVVGAGASDSLGRRAVIVPALVGLGASIFLLALVGNLAALACIGVLFGAAQGISHPTLQAYLVDISPEAQLGRAQALFNGSFNLGAMSSAFIFGPVADHIGQRPMFMVAALTPLAASLLFYQYGAPRDRPVSRGTLSGPRSDVIS